MIGDAPSWVLAHAQALARRDAPSRCCGSTTTASALQAQGGRVATPTTSPSVRGCRAPACSARCCAIASRCSSRATKPGQLPYYDGGARRRRARRGADPRGRAPARHPRRRSRRAAFAEADRDLLADAGGAGAARRAGRAGVPRRRAREVRARAVLSGDRDARPRAHARAGDGDRVRRVRRDRRVRRRRRSRSTTRTRRATGSPRVRIGADGEGLVDPKQLDGLEFKDNAGLASMVVKNRHYLPAGGEPREVVRADLHAQGQARRREVAARAAAARPPTRRSARSTLVARAEKRFGKDVREMLAVIANQVAVSLAERLPLQEDGDDGDDRRPHRPHQPPHVPGALRGSAAARAAPQPQGRAAAVRRRPLQEGQRHLRPPDRRRGAAPRREACCRRCRARSTSPRATAARSSRCCSTTSTSRRRKAVAERIRIEIAKVVVETEKGPLSRHRIDRRRRVPRRRPRSRDADRARRPRALSREAHRPEPRRDVGRGAGCEEQASELNSEASELRFDSARLLVS